jgi:Family of unknown function (DUF6521)
MATTLSEEVRQVQNPALGALLEWRFAFGYSKSRLDASACPLPLLFLVLPLLLHEETYRHIVSTRSTTGLRGFAAKFGTSSSNEGDILLALHDRVRSMRPLSFESLQIAYVSRLLAIDILYGTVFSLTSTFPKSQLSESILPLTRNAEKVGTWCAALTLPEIASILKVRF